MKMLKRYLAELREQAGRWFTGAGILIALVWFLPLVLRRFELPQPRSPLLDPAFLTAVAAGLSLVVGSYRAWVKERGRSAALQQRLDDQQPFVRLAARTQFVGGYSSAPKDLSYVMVEVQEVRNPGPHHLYLETPLVLKSSLSVQIFKGIGRVRLHGRGDDGRNRELDRAPIPSGQSRFDLRVELELPFRIETREELATVMKQLTDASLTLRFTFTPERAPIDCETVVDFASFRSQVLKWWEQEKWTKLLRIYGDS